MQKARLEAAGKLASLRSLRSLSRITEAKEADRWGNAGAQYDAAIKPIQSWQTTVDWSGYVFSGLSLGSILVLMALGLSIIFGVMGVINMAHGELMMIGAYATYVTQHAFAYFAPAGQPDAYLNYYFIAAIPISFFAAAIIGWLMEVLLIRHLYGRPLDTLLATAGVGLILIQAIRWKFSDNVAVNSPAWLQKGFVIAGDITLPYNRLFIIGFCIASILLMYYIMSKTKLGLLMRATTQNRTMAAALGVPTRHIDAYTFALGAGLAGLAGCALTQVGGIGPDMGQNYVVNSFLVVVTGGVGKLAGAIWAGAGMGTLTKFFEPLFGTVWGQVLILMCVVIFLQWRPSGLFPSKGRHADV